MASGNLSGKFVKGEARVVMRLGAVRIETQGGF